MTPHDECIKTMNLMVANTMYILRKDPDNKEIKELWTGIGIMLDKWNADTSRLLTK